MRKKTIAELITKYRNPSDAVNFYSYRLEKPELLMEPAQEIMKHVPPMFGSCALLSPLWARFLIDRYGIPAVAVAGDLRIEGKTVFQCKDNLPDVIGSDDLNINDWDGHCWIEIDGYIGEISLFRTAYAINKPSVLKEYVLQNFGKGRGAIILPSDDLPSGMEYIPKYVLNDDQMDGLIRGLGHLLENRVADKE